MQTTIKFVESYNAIAGCKCQAFIRASLSEPHINSTAVRELYMRMRTVLTGN